MRSQIWIGNWRLRLLPRKPAQQLRIGSELGWSAIELPRMTQHHPVAPMHPLHHAANMHIAIAKLEQLADFITILAEAHNGESASVIRGVRRTHIQKSRPIRQLHHVINMCLYADILVDELCGVVGIDAGFWMCGEKGTSCRRKQKQSP